MASSASSDEGEIIETGVGSGDTKKSSQIFEIQIPRSRDCLEIQPELFGAPTQPLPEGVQALTQ